MADLRDPQKRFSLTAGEIALLNPNTRTCPIFRSRRDAELTLGIYRRVPVLVNEETGENPWDIKFATMFHMSNDSGLFRTREQLVAEGWRLRGNHFVRGSDICLPLYEAKMMHQYDHRWATYQGGNTRDVTDREKDDPNIVVLPRYWVPAGAVAGRLDDQQPGWFVGFRDIARSTDERTAIFSVLPEVGFGNKVPLVFVDQELGKIKYLLSACAASFSFDYAARSAIGGTTLNFYIVKQLPMLVPETFRRACPWQPDSAMIDWFKLRVMELTFTSQDLQPFAKECGYDRPPFRWDVERRFLIRCELDAAFFHLYGIARDDVDYIMETFPIVRRKDIAAHDEYRTKRVILEIYDEMARAMQSGQSYKTRLDPPAGDPRAAHPG